MQGVLSQFFHCNFLFPSSNLKFPQSHHYPHSILEEAKVTHPARAVVLFGENVDGAKAATDVARRAPIASENFMFNLPLDFLVQLLR